MKCKICGKEYGALSGHLKRKHNISTHEYYDMFYKKENEDICMLDGCYNKNTFVSISKGYCKYCCREHSSKDIKWKKQVFETWKNKTGAEIQYINKKRDETMVEKYGNKNYPYILMRKSIKNKYGVDNISQTPQVKMKIKNYWKMKTEEEKELTRKKRENTMVSKYGVKYLMLLDEYKNNLLDKTESYRINSGKYISKERQPEFSLYKRKVYSRTKHTAKKKFGEYCSLVGRCGIEGALQVDHLYTIKDGFLNNVDPSILSHPCNLQLISWLDNDMKSESSITLPYLIESIEKENNHAKI